MARQLTALVTFLVTLLAEAGLSQNVLAQSLTTEAAVTVGASTQDVRAAAAQLRAFGDVGGWRFYGDASWATTRGNQSDAFGAAYPYRGKLVPMELKVEKTVVRGERMLGLELGRFRTPFGIYSGSDQGYTGFLRAPLIRNSYYWGLSNNFLESGASIVAGTTRLSAEVSAGVASDEDDYSRRSGLDTVIRLQAAGGPFIAGVSYIRTRPSAARPYANGITEFTGGDLRWMKSGVQLRGEWIDGRPFDGTITRGGYGDVLVHRTFMGPITAIARIERLDYLAGPFSEYPRRYTLGARIRLTQGLTAQLNQIYQPYDGVFDPGHTSFDVALTYNFRPGTLLGRTAR